MHRASIENLAVALHEFQHVVIVDNTAEHGRRVFETRNGDIVFELEPRPAWLRAALAATEFEK